MKKAKKKASRKKKLVLTVDQAELLETALGDYVSAEAGDDGAFRDIRQWLQRWEATKAFIGDLKRLCDTTGSNLEMLQDEVTRMNIEDIMMSLECLDKWLSKNVTVTGLNKSRSRRGYVWEVWNW